MSFYFVFITLSRDDIPTYYGDKSDTPFKECYPFMIGMAICCVF